MKINNQDIGIGILASEKSRRMNVNKALLKIGDQSFIERLCQEFANFGQIYISAQNKETYKDLNYEVIEDAHSGVGPMEGIYQILKATKHEYNFICSVDMPFLKKEVLENLQEQIEGNYDCYVFKDEFRAHPTCAVYSKNLDLLIENLIKNEKYCLLEIFDNSKTKYIDYNTCGLDKKFILNINTNEDYEKLCK